MLWDDAVAQELTPKMWKKRIMEEKPDIIAIETKTPVIKQHWKIINDLKSQLSTLNSKIVLMGDHVVALPKESLENSAVDYVIAHGDYDFGLLNLASHLDKGENLEGGFWFRDQSGNIINSGPADISRHNLENLPLIDRELTRWKDYAYKNGNFKYTPGAYIMSGRDCWWGGCSFCSWASIFPGKKYRKMSPEKAIDEIGNLIRLGAREIMEDSGTLPVGDWLKKFCREMIRRGYNKKVRIGCNMRIGAIKDKETWQLMKEAGFRFALFGVESANQETLDRINKNIKAEEIENSLRMCKQAGLEPHATFMVGYPWETKKDAEKTLGLAKNLFKKGIIDTLQATIMVPYPGTKLYDYCRENNLLLTVDYNRFDQSGAVMKSLLSEREIKQKIRSLYKSFLSPGFVFKKISSIRDFKDVSNLCSVFWKWKGKLKDFC